MPVYHPIRAQLNISQSMECSQKALGHGDNYADRILN